MVEHSGDESGGLGIDLALEVVPVERLTPTDWTVDQAMTFIISGGAVSPDKIPFHRVVVP